MTCSTAPAADARAPFQPRAGAPRDPRPDPLDLPPSRARARTRFPGPRSVERASLRWLGEDAELERFLQDHAAASGVVLDAAPAGSPAGEECLLVVDRAGLEGLDVDRDRDAIVLVADGHADLPLLSRALEAGARAVLQAPSQSERLLELLAQIGRPRQRALRIGVVGGCGGAGASSLAARLAGAARGHGDCVLLDADPLGGGLDVLVEMPALDGVTWSDISGIDAADSTALREALPRVDHVSLLAAGSGPGADPAALDRALTALGPGGGTVIADLAPHLLPAAAPHLDRLLLLVPAREHAVRAAARRLDAWSQCARSAEVIVRRQGPLSPREVGDLLGLPVAGAFRDASPGTVPLLDRRRSGADALCRRMLASEAAA